VGSISTYLTRGFTLVYKRRKRSREVAKTFAAFNLSAQDVITSGTQELIKNNKTVSKKSFPPAKNMEEGCSNTQ
jgi:hypothetical protein